MEILYHKVTQHTFVTRFMQQVIFKYCVNELRTYLFIPHRVLHGVLRSKGENTLTLPHSEKSKHAFLGEIKKIPITKKIPCRKMITSQLLHQKLGHRHNISLLSGDTANFWEDFELIIDPESFCTSCQTS